MKWLIKLQKYREYLLRKFVLGESGLEIKLEKCRDIINNRLEEKLNK